MPPKSKFIRSHINCLTSLLGNKLGKKRSRGRPTLASTSGRSYWIQKSLNAYLILLYSDMFVDITGVN
ncbi:hypothetical protein BpHYR1_004227 [Brachionus plicatilis]|uniref:Uncharacterized protein n=1 Tax=Brachionus plicatilis TaxID=10195 RepID=A0A3M7QBR5_BRAPC|nr:hypothetical protein BpHYR1_004227 [Brachionus plicatilis]